MGLRINTNMPSLTAQRSAKLTNKDLVNTYQHLASGDRITQSSDDAAGLAISESLKGQIRGMRQVGRNSQDAISMVQVGEGGLVEIGNNLVRLRELAIQAASDNVGERERGFLDLEYQQLLSEMERVAQSTEFGSVKMLNGSGQSMDFQVGIHNEASIDRISFDAGQVNATTDSLGVAGLNIANKDDAQNSLAVVDTAVEKVAGYRAVFGSVASRLHSTVSQTEIATENLSAANSRIRDADYAEETSKLANLNVRSNASVAVMAAANISNQSALRLLS
jgi:flagellin